MSYRLAKRKELKKDYEWLEKITIMTSEEMQAAIARGENRTDWARVRREAHKDPHAAK